MNKHSKMVWSKNFKDILTGKKTFETLRMDGADYRVGDVVVFVETDSSLQPTGRSAERKISYISQSEESGVREGFGVIGFEQEPSADMPIEAHGGLRDVQATIDDRWGFSEYSKDYLERKDPQRDVGHASIHLMKALGKLSGALDNLDHDGVKALGGTNAQTVSDALADLVICSARVASKWPEVRIDLQKAVMDRITSKFPATGRATTAGTLGSILIEVAKERARQKLLWGSEELWHPLVRPQPSMSLSRYGLIDAKDAVAQKLSRCDDGQDDWMLILVAEVTRFGEAALRGKMEDARRYAVRVAAVAAAIVESIDQSARGQK